VRRLRLLSFAAVAVLAVTMLTGSVAGGAAAPHRQPAQDRPAGGFVVTGAVAHRLYLDVTDLRALPARTVRVTFVSGHGVEHHVYVGPRLFDVLAQTTPQLDPAIKNDKLRYFVSVSASDGYRALVAYGEIDPDLEAKEVLLATSEDGRSLAADGPRLVVPGDRHGGRYVTNVVRVYLNKPER
jgi:DMSO/TMAO reductase YedYZ molybdopterin-dependent catalytic subunit